MAILDEKGRLFGRINVLDLIVLLAVLGAGSWYVYDKFLKPPVDVGNDTVEVTFLVTPLRQESVDKVKPGMEIFDNRKPQFLGEVVSVRSELAKSFGPNGEVVATSSFFDLYVTVRGQGNITKSSVSLGGVAMKVGAEVPLSSNVWSGVSRVLVIPPLKSE